MRWIDLLRMSSSNLKRRKLRTLLTILGVIIGTASIVVMIALGLGSGTVWRYDQYYCDRCSGRRIDVRFVGQFRRRV